MMKRLFWLYALLSLVGCTEIAIEDRLISTAEVYYASIEDGNSRTYVDEQIRMRWTAEDRITLFRKNTYNREYMFTGKTGANAGGFRQVSTDDDFWFGYDVATNYAIYPHSADTELDETELYITYNMPSEQTYVENSFGLGANVMVAVSENSQLMFKNVGSYLRVRLYGENVSVSSITLTSKSNEAIAGKARITPSMDGNPTCEMIGNTQSVRLVCPTPVTISSDANNPTDFWIVLPPITFSKGFSVTVENSDGETQVFDVDKSVTFKRNSYNNLSREVKFESEIPYLTFTADAEQTLTMSKAITTLEYSVNGGEWKELGTNTITFGGNNGDLRLRGQSPTGTVIKNVNYIMGEPSSIQFGENAEVLCSGDIRTLVDYKNYTTASTENAVFYNLFRDCTSLITAPELPAETLADYCYYYMFSGCTGLTEAPELPSTTLAYKCYDSMFQGCTTLTEAPKLPATTLADQCYSYMFRNCTSLTESPELPATTLTMCCYEYMFTGCSNLAKVTMLATNVNAYINSLNGWLDGVASSGTFTKASVMNSLPIGIDGIPTGWTVINKN